MKKIFSIFLLMMFLLTSCSEEKVISTDEVKTKYVWTQIVAKKIFSEDLKLVWKVSSVTETNISPLTSWIINKVNVNIWDEVKAGDILATIDTTSNLTDINLNNAQNTYNNTLSVYSATKEVLEKNLDSAKLQYDNALISRDNTYSSTQKQLELAQAQLQAVQTQKDNTSKTTTTAISLAEESLKSSELNLENFEKNYIETLNTFDVKKKSLVNNLKVAIDSSVATIDSSLYTIDSTLWVTDLNKNANDNYEIYLSAKNTKLKSEAENLFQTANSDFFSLKSNYKQWLSDEEALNLYAQTLDLTQKMVSLFDKMTWVLDNSITSSTFSESTLISLKTTIKTYQSQVLNLKSTLTSLNNSLNDLDNTIVSTKTSLDTQRETLNQSISIAKASLNNAKASSNTSIDSVSSTENTTKIQLESTISSIKSARESADNTVKIAKNQYESAKANYNSSLAWVKSQLDSATGQKNSLNQQVENAYIKAPFDGIIVSKNVEIWQAISQSFTAFKIANSKEKIIKLDVNAENIKYLKVWDEVKIEKNDYTATWVLSVVWASADENTKMFKVEVSFSDEEFKNFVVLWDYVNIYFKKSAWEQKIVIPFSALLVWSNNSYSVYLVWSWSLIVDKKVEIWESNSSEVVINSWLNEGDRVVVSWALDISVWDKVEENK